MWLQVADRLKRQYLSEMMSTRLGVKRAAAVKSAAKRQGSDGKEYYDIQVGLLATQSMPIKVAVASKAVRGVCAGGQGWASLSGHRAWVYKAGWLHTCKACAERCVQRSDCWQSTAWQSTGL